MNLSFFSTIRNPMDIAMSYHLYHKLLQKEEQTSIQDKKKEIHSHIIYQSPKRDNICHRCGQQLHWCVCNKYTD